MQTLHLGFKAFDPHELLCHFVARKSGLYSRENLHVEPVDITFMAETDLPLDMFQVSCGAALGSALKGIPQRILFVATDKPMFWIYSKEEIQNMGQLKNTRMATYPTAAPPYHLANMILSRSDINIDREITLLSARDDAARWGLLKSGDVDAAVISSAISPVKVQGAGFNRLCFFGNEIRIPTTGLAVHQSYLEKETPLVQTLVRIHKESLSIIHHDPDILASVLREYFDMADELVNDTAGLYRQYYTRDGKTTGATAQNAVAALCRSLSVSTVPDWKQIYLFTEQH